MITKHLATPALLAVSLGLAACGGSTAAPLAAGPRPTTGTGSRPTTLYTVAMTGSAESPRGAPHGQGVAIIAFHGASRLCFRFSHLRGFVDAIDAEMHSAKLFLILNNNHPDFIVGHTRILHAWSLGLCLIAHRNMALAVPEIVHGENALLGSSGEEIAGHVAAALRDPDLRRAIAAGGRRTFEREFLPPTVVGRVMKRIEDDLATER